MIVNIPPFILKTKSGEKMKTILIDGNNLCHRVYWANMNLTYNDKPIGCVYGFFKSLVFLKQKYPSGNFIIAWDRKSQRRKMIAAEAIEKGLITKDYKENRKERQDEKKDDFKSIYEQMDIIREGLNYVNCFQIHMDNEEADDIIYSYVKTLEGDKVIVSSDNDFLQCLEYDDVVIFDAMKKMSWNKEVFEEEFGFSPALWVDAGAIIGDKSDEIQGVEGWGPKTTYKYIIEHGNINDVLNALKNKDKLSKKEQMLLDSEELLSYARKLKQMYVLDNLPVATFDKREEKDLYAFFGTWGFNSLTKDVFYLV